MLFQLEPIRPSWMKSCQCVRWVCFYVKSDFKFEKLEIGNWIYHILRGIFWNCRFRDGWMKVLEHILVQGPVELQLITLQCSILTGPKKAQCSKKSVKNEQKIREIISFLPKKLKNLIWFFFQKEWVRKDHRSDEIFL